MANEFTAELRAAYGVPEISPAEDIWLHVQFLSPPTVSLDAGRLEPGRTYLGAVTQQLDLRPCT